MATITNFKKFDMRVGTIIKVEDFITARNPSYIVYVDFGGDLQMKKSTVQATNYSKEALIGKQIVAVTNLPAKKMNDCISEVFILGVRAKEGGLSLLVPDDNAENGERIF
ncbi:MAG: hypothetical protein A2161_04080 [Candidatus Schekmanbacteria bacterium RBG_13_48_7]|uniref:tRNA-binding domain-containing protein n=1 Tax=Candidatus Schekmanbacteria bacterium RBG_13_48_7 TaxID=1817878 RepID=A0A1F7RNZ1_9BACT|nr:MAG: hypothetical protein A2161_04080 [Candidatus Schekmanbacteria bacterium RBG_13_48_7]